MLPESKPRPKPGPNSKSAGVSKKGSKSSTPARKLQWRETLLKQVSPYQQCVVKSGSQAIEPPYLPGRLHWFTITRLERQDEVRYQHLDRKTVKTFRQSIRNKFCLDNASDLPSLKRSRPLEFDHKLERFCKRACTSSIATTITRTPDKVGGYFTHYGRRPRSPCSSSTLRSERDDDSSSERSTDTAGTALSSDLVSSDPSPVCVRYTALIKQQSKPIEQHVEQIKEDMQPINGSIELDQQDNAAKKILSTRFEFNNSPYLMQARAASIDFYPSNYDRSFFLSVGGPEVDEQIENQEPTAEYATFHDVVTEGVLTDLKALHLDSPFKSNVLSRPINTPARPVTAQDQVISSMAAGSVGGQKSQYKRLKPNVDPTLAFCSSLLHKKQRKSQLGKKKTAQILNHGSTAPKHSATSPQPAEPVITRPKPVVKLPKPVIAPAESVTTSPKPVNPPSKLVINLSNQVTTPSKPIVRFPEPNTKPCKPVSPPRETFKQSPKPVLGKRKNNQRSTHPVNLIRANLDLIPSEHHQLLEEILLQCEDRNLDNDACCRSVANETEVERLSHALMSKGMHGFRFTGQIFFFLELDTRTAKDWYRRLYNMATKHEQAFRDILTAMFMRGLHPKDCFPRDSEWIDHFFWKTDACLDNKVLDDRYAWYDLKCNHMEKPDMLDYPSEREEELVNKFQENASLDILHKVVEDWLNVDDTDSQERRADLFVKAMEMAYLCDHRANADLRALITWFEGCEMGHADTYNNPVQAKRRAAFEAALEKVLWYRYPRSFKWKANDAFPQPAYNDREEGDDDWEVDNEVPGRAWR